MLRACTQTEVTRYKLVCLCHRPGIIIFFGDSCSPEGNDYDIYVDVKENDGESYWVDSPSDTLKLLK